jgi:acyl carrier protein
MRDKIKSRMAEILRVAPAKLTDEAQLTDVVQDSFMLIEMIIEIQEEFHFRINQEDLTEVRTFAQLLDVIETKLK